MNHRFFNKVLLGILIIFLTIILINNNTTFSSVDIPEEYKNQEKPESITADPDVIVPNRFIVDMTNNYFDRQGPDQCSAYSCAFVLRNLGYEDVTGNIIYDNMEGIMEYGPLKNGVLFSGLIKTFKDYRHELKMKRSENDNIDVIRQTLIKGAPVIVLIGDGFVWQHYTVIVGYDMDKQEVYFYDPAAGEDLNNVFPGNRTYTEKRFMQLWNNGLERYDRLFFETILEPTLN